MNQVATLEGFRLAPQQRQIWKLQGSGVQLFAQLVIRIDGPLDHQTLQSALGHTVARHEILRTVFRQLPGMKLPLQVILDSVQPSFESGDVPAAEKNIQLALARLQIEQRALPMDFEFGPLVRAYLAIVSAREHYLLLTVPALVADATTLANLFDEMVDAYDGILRGFPLFPDDKIVQYVQYSEWQNTIQDEVDDDVEQAHAFWSRSALEHHTQLPEELVLTQLPERLVHLEGSHANEINTIVINLSEHQRAQLTNQSNACGSSTQALVMACWQTLLWQHVDRAPMVLGYQSEVRNIEEVRGVLGPLAKVLPLAGSYAPDFCFGELLRHTERQFAEAERWQDYYDHGIEATSGEMRHLPIRFSWIEHPIPRTTGNVRFTVELLDATIGCFDLQLLYTAGEELRLELCYRPQVLDHLQAERIADRFGTLLDVILADRERPLRNLELVGRLERAQLLNMSRGSLNISNDFCIHRLFESNVAAAPQSIAVVGDDGTLNFAELNATANQLARYLRQCGVTSETPVGICFERSTSMIVAMLGILKAGGAYVPLDPASPAARLGEAIAAANVKLVLADETTLTHLSRSESEVIDLELALAASRGLPNQNLDLSIVPDQLAYIIFTSGSTGVPKGVAVAHRQVVNYTLALIAQHGLTPGMRFATVSTLAADLANTAIFPALLGGGALHVLSRERLTDPAELAAYFEKHAIDCFKTTPSHLATLQEALPKARLLPKQRLFLGGEAYSWEWARQLALHAPECQVLNHYGPTEATVGVLTHLVSPADKTHQSNSTPLGQPLANNEIYLLNTDAQLVPIGMVGELCLGGPQLARGYVGRSDLTAERFIPHPFSSEPGARLYRTGDLARVLPDGNLAFLGRSDDQVKIRGYRIELGEIERVLSQHDAVARALVLTHEPTPGHRELVAYVASANCEMLQKQSAALPQGQVSQWRMIFENLYGQVSASNASSPTFELTGWNSSYTMEPLLGDEIAESVQQTVDRILALRPRRILEIGCGSGLLLFRLAPHCELYHATDFSQQALDYLSDAIAGSGLRAEQIVLERREANDFQGFEPDSFDLILLNSVVQYFPTVDYLVDVIRGALGLLPSQGSIYIGDIRFLGLLNAFHSSVQLFRASEDQDCQELRQRIKHKIMQERELLIDPDLFLALQREEPQISDVETQLKRGRYQNELTKFRYDVLLHAGLRRNLPESLIYHSWESIGNSLERLRDMLSTEPRRPIAIKNIPNRRVLGDMLAGELLADQKGVASAGAVQAAVQVLEDEGIDPETFWQLGQEFKYFTQVLWSATKSVTAFDAIFVPGDEWLVAASSTSLELDEEPVWGQYANDPTREEGARKLIPQLREFLQSRLPDYMVPTTLIVLNTFPLEQNGKVDRSALPAPDFVRTNQDKHVVAPNTPVEEAIAELWSELLNIEEIGTTENFFDLGGHSLMATQVIYRLRDMFGVDIPLVVLFEEPTIAGVALIVTQAMLNQVDAGELSNVLDEMIQSEAL